MVAGDVIRVLMQIAVPIILITIAVVVRNRRKNKKRQYQQRPAYTVPTRTAYAAPSYSMDIERIKQLLDVKNMSNMEIATNGFTYSVPLKHKYAIFSKIKLVQFSGSSIKVFANLRKRFPSNLDIMRRDIRTNLIRDEFFVHLLSNVYILSSESSGI
ncbi:MAG: hypothetical protein ACXABK_05855, partial [Candidatus Heimdallarchaeaceae archaeon]